LKQVRKVKPNSLPAARMRDSSKAVYGARSLAEHLPNASRPCSHAGLRAVNKATGELSDLMNINVLEAEYQYRVVNGYVTWASC